MTQPTNPTPASGTPASDGPAPGAIADVLPLSPLQEGLLFHHALAGGETDVYGIQLRVELLGRVDPQRLRRSAVALLIRHPNLRAGFLHEELDQPVQFVPADIDLDWTRTDLGADAGSAHPEELEAAEERVAEREFAKGFDLATPPLIRFHALTTGPTRTVLVVTAHHVLLDGWSLPILVRDLLRLYEVNGDGAALPVAPHYRNHLAWLNGRDHGTAREAWAAALETLTEPTLLAPAVTGSSATSSSIETSLDATVSQRLRALAAETGVTVNTVLQVTWALTLATHTGRDDVVFGQPVSGRPPEVPRSQDTVGLFTNTLPVRIALDPAEPLADLLVRVRMDQADLLDHQWTGLAEVQRAAGRGTLFDTLLVVENYPLDEAAVRADHAGVRAGDIQVRDATHYPATLTVLPGEGPGRGTVLRLDHLPAAVPEPVARQLLVLFEYLLTQVCADPRRTPRELDPLTPVQRSELSRHNTTAHPTTHSTITALLAAAERAHPERPAVVTEGRELTYRQLHGDAARLARLLSEHGVGPDTAVAVALPRGTELVTALVAAVRSGGGYLPLDLDHPPARLADMAERAGAIVVVTTSAQREALTALPNDIVRVELDDPGIRTRLAGLTPLPWSEPHPDQLAYTLFTSGSTGSPKGVGISHRAIANRVEWTQHAYQLTPEDRVAQKTPVGFDVSVWEFLWPLAVGAAIVPAHPGGHRDPAYLVEFLAEQRVTVCHFVPAMLRLFLDELTSAAVSDAPAPAPASGRALRLVIASGEALSEDLARTFAAALPTTALENLYGPTEAAIDVTSHPAAVPERSSANPALTAPGRSAPKPVPTPGSSVPIGRPVWNTRLHVLDHALRPVPPEAVGELYLGGVQLARGYVGRPDLTASRFVADPSGPHGARLYRTGDLVRRRADGAVLYLGRSDDQVKINGVRVEPGEVEVVLRALNGVADAAVTVRTTGPSETTGTGTGATPGTTTLAGYAVPDPGRTLDPDHLHAQLATALPAALVPATITVLDRLPLSVNGKVDRKALPEPAPVTSSGRAPTTEAELVLSAAIADLLGLSDGSVPADADFFSLGGDSVTSIRLVGRARSAGLEFTVRDVFTHRTPQRLAAHADQTSSAEEDQPATEAPEPTEPAPTEGEEFTNLLDAGDMEQLQQLRNTRD